MARMQLERRAFDKHPDAARQGKIFELDQAYLR
jgi:hypothetical protein